MGKYRINHNIAGIIFLIVGTLWWLIPAIQQSGHHGHMEHGATVLGFTEMTWMWYVMAIVHFFINDASGICSSCMERLTRHDD